MKAGIYKHQLNMRTQIWKKEMEDKGLDVSIYDKCACHTKIDPSLDIVIVHPEDNNNNKCWTGIQKIIQDNPTKQFYIIAIGKPQRIEGIGRYPNLTYLTERNMLLELNHLEKQIENQNK